MDLEGEILFSEWRFLLRTDMKSISAPIGALGAILLPGTPPYGGIAHWDRQGVSNLFHM